MNTERLFCGRESFLFLCVLGSGVRGSDEELEYKALCQMSSVLLDELVHGVRERRLWEEEGGWGEV